MESGDGPLVLALHSLSFLSASPLERCSFVDETIPLIAPVQSVPKTPLVCRNPSERLLGFLSSVSFGHLDSTFPPLVLHRNLSLEVAHQAFLQHGQFILAVIALRQYACFASLVPSEPLCLVFFLAT